MEYPTAFTGKVFRGETAQTCRPKKVISCKSWVSLYTSVVKSRLPTQLLSFFLLVIFFLHGGFFWKRKHVEVPVNPEWVSWSNRLGWKILHDNAVNEGGNAFVFSPFLLFSALSGLSVYTDLYQKPLLQEITGKNILPAELLTAVTILRQSVFENLDYGTEVHIAESLWAGPQVHLDRQFKKSWKEVFLEKPEKISKRNPVEKINQWFKKKTNKRTDHIIDGLHPEMDLLFFSNFFWRSRWENSLWDVTAAPQNYQIQGLFSYLHEEEFEAVSLPNRENRTSLYFFVPKKPVLEWLAQQDGSLWENWRESFLERIGEVEVPKMQFWYGNDFQHPVSASGFKELFLNGVFKTDWLRKSEDLLGLDALYHQVVLHMDAQPGKASTLVDLPQQFGRDDQFQLKIKDSYFFLLRDNRTGLILLMGWKD